jgi:hypothetical protein
MTRTLLLFGAALLAAPAYAGEQVGWVTCNINPPDCQAEAFNGTLEACHTLVGNVYRNAKDETLTNPNYRGDVVTLSDNVFTRRSGPNNGFKLYCATRTTPDWTPQ